MSRSCLTRRRWLAIAAVFTAALGFPAAGVASGVAPYHPAQDYAAGAVVLGSDGNAYRAAAAVKGSDPVTSGGGAWRLAHVATDLVLDVPGRFKTIPEAWEFLAGARITETATVTIALAPGKLEHDKPLVLNHSEGARIVIRGAGEKPEDCVLAFDEVDAVVNGGDEITLENLTMTPAENTGKGNGLLVDGRSVVTVRDCHFVDFGCFVDGNSKSTFTECEFRRSSRGDAMHIRNGAQALVTDCVATAQPEDSSGVAYSAYNGGTLYCVGCRAEGWGAGFKAYTNSVMHLERCVGRDNKIGASAWFSSSMNVFGSVFAKNTEVGVAALFATAIISDCRLTDNGMGAWTIGNAYIQFLGKPSTISGSRIGIEAKAGGRADLIAKPVFTKVGTELSVGGRPCDLTIEQAFTNND